MKRFVPIVLTTMLMTTPVLADLPDTYTSAVPDELYEIDADSLTEDELRTAYIANSIHCSQGHIRSLFSSIG